jgi:hypothetical protein
MTVQVLLTLAAGVIILPATRSGSDVHQLNGAARCCYAPCVHLSASAGIARGESDYPRRCKGKFDEVLLQRSASMLLYHIIIGTQYE